MNDGRRIILKSLKLNHPSFVWAGCDTEALRLHEALCFSVNLVSLWLKKTIETLVFTIRFEV